MQQFMDVTVAISAQKTPWRLVFRFLACLACLALVMAPRKEKAVSNLRLTPFLRGVIYGLLLAGWTYREIADEVVKPDGTHPCQQAVANVAAQVKSRGGYGWSGESTSSEAGRPRSTTTALDRAILKLVYKHRGRTVVTVKYVQKMVKAARKVSSRTISRRLGEAGLAWLRRRRKTWVSEKNKVARLDWAAWVLGRTVTNLARWAYSDGTAFYLGRSEGEVADKARGALGPYVWKQADGSDALFEDCVGPSAYWKAQGMPVKIWGLLVAGALFVWVLPQDENMTGEWYAWVIRHKFPAWLGKALGRKAKKGVFLVQDHEKALWRDVAREAMVSVGINLLENFPKSSQDLNPIETAWRELRARLYVTAPAAIESREDFIRRLRLAVAWLNVNRASYFEKICGAQKEWARDVEDMDGARTKH